MQSPLFIRRRPDACAQFGVGASTFYEWVSDGLMPPGITLGPQARGWPQKELDAIAAARIRGATNDEIRDLVSQLIEQRKEVAA
jgi:prophage regulatory protein